MTQEFDKVESSASSEQTDCQHQELVLETTSGGYLTGNYVCKDCGAEGIMVVFREPEKA